MPADRRTILVHIGAPKTGTTTLQGWLSRNRASLAAQGVCYPLETANHNDLYLALCDAPHREHPLIRLGYTDPEAAAERVERFAAQLADAILAAREPVVLVSGESLARLSPAGVDRLSRWLAPLGTAQIACCLRDPVHFAVSDAQEAIKGGMTYAQVCREPPIISYRAILEPYLAAFGADSVTVFPYAPRLGLDRAFAAATGVPVSFDPDDPPAPRNQALSMEAALLLSDLNTRFPMFLETGANPARGVIPHAWLSGIGRTPFTLPARTLARIRQQTRADLAWVRAHFGIDLAQDPAAGVARTRATPSGGVSEPVAALLPGVADTLHRAACLVGDLMAARLLAEALGTKDSACGRRLLEQALTVRPGHAPSRRALDRLLARTNAMD